MSSLSSSLLRFGYRFAPFDAALHGVNGKLRISSRMTHSSSMKADLDTTSSPSVDVLHVLIYVFVDVVLGRSRDVALRWSYELMRVKTSCDVSDWMPDDESRSRSRSLSRAAPVYGSEDESSRSVDFWQSSSDVDLNGDGFPVGLNSPCDAETFDVSALSGVVVSLMMASQVSSSSVD